MDGYELAFWIAVAAIAALIWAICKPVKREHPEEIKARVYGAPQQGETHICRRECDDYGGHNWHGDTTDTAAYLRHRPEGL